MSMEKVIQSLILLLIAFMPAFSWAGIFAPAAGQPNSTAVEATDTEIDGWATGYIDYQPGLEVDLEFQTPERSVGEPGNSDGNNTGTIFDIVSLGRGGSITLTFNAPIKNGAGYDFAVFENSFVGDFLELAKVEVSSDGTNFVAFPAFSLVPAPIGGFGSVDTTDLEQVAGKYRGGYGTPFDLEQLSASGQLDINNVRYVRLIDIVGDGTATNDLTPQSLADWFGVPLSGLPQSLIDIANSAPAVIYDPYPTIGSAGFDLDAVAVLHSAPTLIYIDVSNWDTNNEVDPASTGRLPVTVFTSHIADGDMVNFEATSIDPSSVRLGKGNAAVVGAPYIGDVDFDGNDDMSFMFDIQDTGIACDDIDVPIVGQTTDGVEFTGIDFITTINCDSGGCHP